MCHDSFYAPLYHGPLILLFKALGKPVMLYGSTIVPPRASAGRKEIALRNFLNRLFLGKADMITLRERMSYDYLRSLNLNNTAVYPDLAFLTDTAPDDEVDAVLTDEKIPRDAPLCGFAFSQKEIAFAHPGQPAHERREKALRALAALMDHITCDLGLNAVFIPHAIGPTPRVDDRIAAEWIHERCRRRDRIFIMRKDYSQALLKGIARKLDMTVGTRLHLTIDAVCHGVPSMLITHRGEFRCHGIVGDMLGQADCVYDTEDVKAEDLIRMADVIWDRREHLRKELEARLLGIIENTRMHAVLAQDVYRRSSSRNE
jgi:polysaccharide pyruvyl transferase WcaK-like protein